MYVVVEKKDIFWIVVEAVDDCTIAMYESQKAKES